MRIRVITTGGTIDKVYFDAKSTYQVGEPLAGEVLREAGVAFEYEVEPVMRKDSLEITPEDRARIREAVERCPEARVVVTHGTDTMAETGRALAGIPGKTVVLTGAIQPGRFRSTDAPFNLGFAVAAVQILPAGVYLAMNGRVFDPFRVRKNLRTNRFEPVEPRPGSG